MIPYMYLYSFSSTCCTFYAIITSLFSPFQVSIVYLRKLHFFVSFKQILFCNFFVPTNIQPLFFFIRFFLFVFSWLIVHQLIYCNCLLFLFYLLVSWVAFLLIFPHMLGLPNLKSTILVNIMYPFQFQHAFLVRRPYYLGIIQFGSNHCSYHFCFHHIFIWEVKCHNFVCIVFVCLR